MSEIQKLHNEVKKGFSLLKPAVNQTAYLKAGILGFAGSGKTYTAAELAIGLSKDIGDDKPVAFFDTETGSDFLIPKFKQAGVELLVAKTRAFKDLLDFMREAEASCSVAVIDSISHVWKDLLESYVRKLNRKSGLYFQDWGPIKAEWGQFTDLFINSRLHVVMCGRAGYEYDYEENAETGRKDLVKTGTKMKAETEMGYEPSLLLEMIRLKKAEVSGDIHDKGWINRCVVLKDRTDTMNGKEIDYPKYKDFSPVIHFLNVGGEHIGVDTSRNSESLFDGPERSVVQRARMVEIALEEMQQELILMGLDGTSTEAKKKRTELLMELFGTSSKTAIESQSLEKLQAAVNELRARRLQPEQGKAVNQ